MAEYWLLSVWLVGLFLLVGGAVYFIYRGVREDSVRYDELYVWKAKGAAVTTAREESDQPAMAPENGND